MGLTKVRTPHADSLFQRLRRLCTAIIPYSPDGNAEPILDDVRPFRL